ncbi:MAG: hypothetical protein K2X99_03620 [Gemmatimonadaceae bacterium]|nr:hypothetical protein [Gemmatimonadaceae bacterium]
MSTPPMHAAALAGVPSGVQTLGPWAGRRQLFVRFAGEAETATMYTSTALARELERQTGRSRFHSVCIGGRDPLGNVPFLMAALAAAPPSLPVMLDTDGQRPEALAMLAPSLAMTQVTVEFGGGEAALTHAVETISGAAGAGCAHALALCPREDTTDAVILRLIGLAHEASALTQVVIHPTMAPDSALLDRRWAAVLEQATALHADTRLALRLPPPTGMR